MKDVLRIIYAPVEVIKDRLKEPARLAGPLYIVLTTTLFMVIALFVQYRKVRARFPENIRRTEIQGWIDFSFTFQMLGEVVALYLLWLVGTGILHCLSILLDGDGEYRKLLELAGLATIPLALFHAFALAVALAYAPPMDLARFADVDLDSLSEMAQEEVSNDMSKEIEKQLRTLPIILLKTAKQLTWLWTMVLWTISLRHSHRLTYTKATMALVFLVLFYGLTEVIKAMIVPGG